MKNHHKTTFPYILQQREGDRDGYSNIEREREREREMGEERGLERKEREREG